MLLKLLCPVAELDCRTVGGVCYSGIGGVSRASAGLKQSCVGPVLFLDSGWSVLLWDWGGQPGFCGPEQSCVGPWVECATLGLGGDEGCVCYGPEQSSAGRQMPKLSNKKLCADAECSQELWSSVRVTIGFLVTSLTRPFSPDCSMKRESLDSSMQTDQGPPACRQTRDRIHKAAQRAPG
ncbi:hypothetical protein J4Q44_G00130380 [Coregonus suidteri]|uniref:Uncharacterized protein n=1 Tax=Coregonus suidteri TaxID=861788 RepID=A0AAN8LS40_9TELE